jgi:hypothetical protein
MQTIEDPTKPKRVPGPVIGDPNLAGGPPPPIPASPAPASPAPAPSTPDPFAAMGGGVQVGGGWVPANHPSAQPAGAPAPVGAAPGAPGAAQSPTLYKDALTKMLGDSQTPASLNDPALKAQSEAFSVGQTRASEQARAQAAERNAAMGLSSSGAMDGDIAGILERQGEAESGYNAGLVGDANKSKLQQMQAALAMMGNDMNSAEGRALQKQIADQEAELRRLGISTQADLGKQDLSLRDKLGSGGLNAQIMQMLMQNQQFGQNLGAQTGMFGANLNQQALLSLLGGL